MEKPTMPEITLTAADNGRQLELRKESTFAIRLEGNPTTGYEWRLGKVDERLLKLEQSAFLPPETTAVGAGGVYLFEFTTLAIGTTEVELLYMRSWEAESAAVDTFRTTIVVTD